MSASLKMLLFGCYFPCNDNSFVYSNRVADVIRFIDCVCSDFPDYKVCFVNSHPSLICHLCKLFNLMLKHCYVPNDFGRDHL